MKTVAVSALVAVVLMCHAGCRGLRGGHGVSHMAALRVLPLGGTVSPPKNRRLQVRFLETSPDGKAGRFQVRSGGESYEGWVAEGESLGSFAQPLVGHSGLILTRLTPVEATLMFQWAESF